MTDTIIKVWDEPAIKRLLDTSDQAVERALLTIFARQTSDEQASQLTKHVNGRGFTAHDAGILSDIAQRFPRYGRLTPRQTDLCRKRLKKYWRQLLEEIAAKGGEVSMKPVRSKRAEEPELDEAHADIPPAAVIEHAAPVSTSVEGTW